MASYAENDPDAPGALPAFEGTTDTVSMHALPAPAMRKLAKGACVGRYVILGTLGEGGMGVVYKAYDPELERAVAVKLLHAGPADDTRAPSAARDDEIRTTRRERLLREAKALARLSHPNVVAVHDVGTFEDDVFIATEFVQGATLHGWLREAKRTRAEVLRAFLQAGEGLAAAHRAGLVHRDFKPANAIIGDDARVRVLDFGLARGAGEDSKSARSGERERERPREQDDAAPPSTGSLESPLTREGQIMGTPRYMAPEQHLGAATDARTDQFSFCVSLYEALYGEPPFASGDDAYKTSVVDGRMKAPPTGSDVPRWLAKVIARGLAKNPEDRYPSMDALLEALRKDPVAKRRRALAFGAVAAVLLAGAGAFAKIAQRAPAVCRGAEVQLDGVWDDAKKSAIAGAFSATGKPYANDAYAKVARALDAYAAKWVGMRTSACEATRVRGEQSEDLLDLRMQCLDSRLRDLRAQVEVLAHADSGVVERAAQAALTLPSIDACADAAALRDPVRMPTEPAARERIETAQNHLAVARAKQRVGVVAEAKAAAESAVSVASTVAWKPLEAEALFVLGDVEDDAGRYAQAEKLLTRAASAALAGRANVVAIRALTALVAETGLRQTRFDDAHAWALLAEGAAVNGDAFVRGELARNNGRVYQREGKLVEARAAIEQCLALWEPLLGKDDVAIAGPLTDLGNVFYAEHRWAEAGEHYERSIAVLAAALGRDNPRLAANLNNLGSLYSGEGDFARSVEMLERARALWEESLGAEHPKVALAIYNIGETRLKQGELDRAYEQFARARAIYEKAVGAAHPDTAMAREGIGEVKLAKRDLDAAETEIAAALAIREKVLGADHTDVAESLGALGRVALARGQTARAIALLERAVAIWTKAGQEDDQAAEARFALARALWARDGASAGATSGDRARARTLAAEAKKALEPESAPDKKRAAEIDAWLAHPSSQ